MASECTFEDYLRDLALGGVTWFQVRLKGLSTRRLLEFSLSVLEVARPLGVPVTVNDRVDVALAAGADGVHLGADDLPVAAAREIAGEKLRIGATVRNVGQARAAAAAGADYLGVGSVFPSSVKPDVMRVDQGAFSEVRRGISLPIVAIGGINEENVDIPISWGADGVAVITALRRCLKPKEAASRLRSAIDKARKR
jgi:thiamine-phosphate diphosphorylase